MEDVSTKKPLYKTGWGILTILIFWPFSLSYWIWKRNWNIKTKIGILVVIWLIVIVVGSGFQHGLIKTQSEDVKIKAPISTLTTFTLTPIPTSPSLLTQILTSTISITQYPTKTTEDYIVINKVNRLGKKNIPYDALYIVPMRPTEITEKQLKNLSMKIKNNDCSGSCLISIHSTSENAVLGFEYNQLSSEEERQKWQQNHPDYFKTNTLLGVYDSDDNSFDYLVFPTDEPTETPEPTAAPIPLSKGLKIVVTSLIVKKINNNFRYFFDIRNKDTEPFKGIVTITLYNTNDTFITEQGFDTKDLNSEKIEPGLGMSRYIDALTGPPDYHGEFGVAKFKYKVMIDNQTVKEDEGNLSSKREEISL
ncbi:hypothetical protein HY945_04960 [Candidatus Gottesmanbacteria bacterium]|nr:hypothetical protein [Candidatus Gottesmanbacteria bacterium]